MKESRTTYSYLIEHMQEPSFQKVWDIAFDFVRKLPSDLCDELHESLNRGVDVLDSEPLLQMYIYAFGKMHNAKLQYAFEHLRKNILDYREIEIVDYGCGQGLATICYHDFLQGHNIEQMVKKITLIEPSTMALSRAELLCSKFYPDAEIIAINKQFDDLTNEDLSLSPYIPTIHLLSNILDVDSYGLQHFSQIVKEQSVGDNEYVLVSPMQNIMRIKRLKDFVTIIEKTTYFEQYLDKRQLDSDKDWTCAVLLCSQRNIIEYDCNKVFEEAKTVADNKSEILNEEYCSELFHKLQICARYGDKRCQNMLGIWYKNGIGTKKNYNLAFEWFKKSAEQCLPPAICNLGHCYFTGNGIEKNVTKAVELYTVAINLGYYPIYSKMARCYMEGIGVEKDVGKAISLLQYASDKNDTKAQVNLGACYLDGLGVEVDYSKGIELILSSAEKGNTDAYYLLGKCYREGLGVDTSIPLAIRYFTIAGLLKDKRSIASLIEMLEEKEYQNLFGDEQFDVFIKGVHLEMPEISRITSISESTETFDGDVVYGINELCITRTIGHVIK